jgi:hypothetical protein
MPKGIYVRTKRINKVKQPKQTTRTVSIKEASDVMMYLVKDIKDFGITFDHSLKQVELIWGEEIFKVSPDEMPKTIECVKYLNERKLQYDFNGGIDG